ncbi:MAG TPA: hypothetical protein VLG49_07815 [Rhabdochlamydiaceae bacterium]|nr:hypothetical protein [Rhabdochlamydiaceae bacterium]
MKKTAAGCILLGIAVSLCLHADEQVAWERKPMDPNRCTKQGKSMQRCEKENNDDNQYNFESYLSPDAYKVYENFTPDQKIQAMDYADNNSMDPNDAVAKVAKEIKG